MSSPVAHSGTAYLYPGLENVTRQADSRLKQKGVRWSVVFITLCAIKLIQDSQAPNDPPEKLYL